MHTTLPTPSTRPPFLHTNTWHFLTETHLLCATVYGVLCIIFRQVLREGRRDFGCSSPVTLPPSVIAYAGDHHKASSFHPQFWFSVKRTATTPRLYLPIRLWSPHQLECKYGKAPNEHSVSSEHTTDFRETKRMLTQPLFSMIPLASHAFSSSISAIDS